MLTDAVVDAADADAAAADAVVVGLRPGFDVRRHDVVFASRCGGRVRRGGVVVRLVFVNRTGVGEVPHDAAAVAGAGVFLCDAAAVADDAWFVLASQGDEHNGRAGSDPGRNSCGDSRHARHIHHMNVRNRASQRRRLKH